MYRLFTLALVLLLVSCKQNPNKLELSSPDSDNQIIFELINGKLYYSVSREDEVLIAPSRLGFKMFGGKDLMAGFTLTEYATRSFNEVWNPVWGENEQITEAYNELSVSLENETGRKLQLIFRAFDDGVAFRYVIPQRDSTEQIIIMDEYTEFNFSEDFTSWSIPANFDSYEFLYRKLPLSQLENANTPLTVKTASGKYLSIHEAHLENYAEMTLVRGMDSLSFISALAPAPKGYKVKRMDKVSTPWRAVMLAESAGKLIESNLIVNLNPPSMLEETDWITPMKYVGIWWELHLGISTWMQGDRHGATTKNMQKYIDFASAHQIQGVLAEGWNTGWENWGDSGAFSFYTPYSDFDLAALSVYAAERGVSLIGHHETGGDAISYEAQLDSAFAYYDSMGVHAVKTGYAGSIRPKGETHHGQFMVNHHRKVMEAAAKHKLMIDAHEPVKCTGEHRTYPNYMTREGARGMEWNAWSDGNPPSHTCTLPFTRCLAGPLDYTPGIFDVLLLNQKDKRVAWNGNYDQTSIHSTIANQLALMLVIYSPLQMAADLPENYEGHPALGWIEALPVNFSQSKVLEAEIGEYVTIARKQGDNWYVAGIANEQGHYSNIDFDFLDLGADYEGIMYKDSANGDGLTNPLALHIDTLSIEDHDRLAVRMAPGGGFALRLIKQ